MVVINKNFISIFLSLTTLFLSILIGIGLGSSFAGVINNANSEDFGKIKMPEASKIFDIKGRLITELFSVQKREVISLREMPPFLIRAILTREDRDFYSHNGFNFWRTVKAIFNNLFSSNIQGASTITQQLAGLLYADRSEKTIFRKIVELYYAFQLERRLSKDEILELYLNQVYFGHGCYGVEAASQFLFGHSVKEITPAEAVMLVIQIANWNKYSPLKNPQKARNMQKEILNDMIELGYISEKEAMLSFETYWNNFDITRKTAGAFLLRDDKAPFFTMYIIQQLENILYEGNFDVYRDGLQIYTTLNLDLQVKADELMKKTLEKVNKAYAKEFDLKTSAADSFYLPLTDLLALNFNMPHLHVDKERHLLDVIDSFAEDLNPALDIIATTFDLTTTKEIAKLTYEWQRKRLKTSSIQGALVCIDPLTGFIYSMIGGREFSTENQFNYAVQAKVHPGSAFKPLFYAAAIEEKRLSPSSILKDEATYFIEENGRLYIPENYGEVFRGDVTVREALAYSLNIPAINTLQIIGFDSAIDMASKLLGIFDPNQKQQTFPRSWSLALGVVNVSPLKMAQAFASFANGGKGIEPQAILYIKDRTGRVLVDLEAERISKNQFGAGQLQLMKPQTAYLMTDILKDTLKFGTMSGAKNTYLSDFKYSLAGKTGTTQNWHDAWTVGYSPYLVTAVWFGFDTGGGSLGTNRTGAALAAPVWAQFMREAHNFIDKDKAKLLKSYQQIEKNYQENNIARSVSLEDVAKFLKLPIYWYSAIKDERSFNRPPGLIEFSVCKKSGLRPSFYCSKVDTVSELFYPENVPEKECPVCKAEFLRQGDQKRKILDIEFNIDVPPLDTSGLPDPSRLPTNIDDYLSNRSKSGLKPYPTNPSEVNNTTKPINPYMDE